MHWLQAAHCYADLRIPAGRPSFDGVRGLTDCSPEQVRWLATQQGFAGMLNETPEGWHWVREVDYQTPTANRDLGRLRYTDAGAATMIEEGVESPYVEEWARVEHASEAFALRLEPSDRLRGYLVAAGSMFLLAIDRRPHPDQSASLSQLAFQDSRWLDAEISLGTRGRSLGDWRITRSTLPWREGSPLFADATARFDASSNVLVDGGDRWRLIDPMPQNMTAPPLGLMH